MEIPTIPATVAIDAHNVIGESPIWDARQRRLLWLDQAAGLIYEARSDGAGGWRMGKQWNFGRPLAALIPRRQDGFVVAAGTDIFLFDDVSGVSELFVSLQINQDLARLNEARCDAQGRLWVTTLAIDFYSPHAALYRVDPDRTVTEILSGVRVGNGLGWSEDGATFYFTDSMRRCVDAFDFDATRGAIANRRTVVVCERCAPDGLSVDRDNCLWIAAAGVGEVRRYSPEGELLARVRIATPGVTSCAFGGDHGEDLFITSIGIRMPDVACRLGVPPEMLENNYPASGALFVCRPGPSGAPAMLFAG